MKAFGFGKNIRCFPRPRPSQHMSRAVGQHSTAGILALRLASSRAIARTSAAMSLPLKIGMFGGGTVGGGGPSKERADERR